jgi:ankyrin repeat protein
VTGWEEALAGDVRMSQSNYSMGSLWNAIRSALSAGFRRLLSLIRGIRIWLIRIPRRYKWIAALIAVITLIGQLNGCAKTTADIIGVVDTTGRAILCRGASDTTLLSAAIDRGDDTVVLAALAACADPNGPIDGSESRVSLAMHAALHGRHVPLERMLDGGWPRRSVNLNASDRDGRTLLHHAAQSCNAETVALVLRHKPGLANQPQVATTGPLPAHVALQPRCVPGIYSMLRSLDGQLPVDRLRDDLIRFAKQRDQHALGVLGALAQGTRGWPGLGASETLMMFLAQQGDAEALAPLLSMQNVAGQIDAVGRDGATALMVAARAGHRGAVEVLLTGGASLRDGAHSVTWLSDQLPTEMANRLREYRTQLSTALRQVVQMRGADRSHIANLLVRGADPSRSAGGRSAYAVAAAQSDDATLRTLLDLELARPSGTELTDEQALLAAITINERDDRPGYATLRLLVARGFVPDQSDRVVARLLEVFLSFGWSQPEIHMVANWPSFANPADSRLPNTLVRAMLSPQSPPDSVMIRTTFDALGLKGFAPDWPALLDQALVDEQERRGDAGRAQHRSVFDRIMERTPTGGISASALVAAIRRDDLHYLEAVLDKMANPTAAHGAAYHELYRAMVSRTHQHEQLRTALDRLKLAGVRPPHDLLRNLIGSFTSGTNPSNAQAALALIDALGLTQPELRELPPPTEGCFPHWRSHWNSVDAVMADPLNGLLYAAGTQSDERKRREARALAQGLAQQNWRLGALADSGCALALSWRYPEENGSRQTERLLLDLFRGRAQRFTRPQLRTAEFLHVFRQFSAPPGRFDAWPTRESEVVRDILLELIAATRDLTASEVNMANAFDATLDLLIASERRGEVLKALVERFTSIPRGTAIEIWSRAIDGQREVAALLIMDVVRQSDYRPGAEEFNRPPRTYCRYRLLQASMSTALGRDVSGYCR